MGLVDRYNGWHSLLENNRLWTDKLRFTTPRRKVAVVAKGNLSRKILAKFSISLVYSFKPKS